jgi:hypothetical protein
MGATTSFADRGIHFPLPLSTRFLEMPVLAEVRENTGFLAFLFEPF